MLSFPLLFLLFFGAAVAVLEVNGELRVRRDGSEQQPPRGLGVPGRHGGRRRERVRRERRRLRFGPSRFMMKNMPPISARSSESSVRSIISAPRLVLA